MKTIICKWTIAVLKVSAIGLILCSCDKIDSGKIISDNVNLIQTRADPEFINKDWVCSYCNNRNFEWRSRCSVCGKPYSTELAQYTTTLWTIINGKGFITEIEGLNEGNIDDRVQLPNGNFPSIAPEPWYEAAGAKKYYEQIKKSSIYMLTPGYAEGADYAWYHTTHILYPGSMSKSDVERLYTRWKLNEGRKLEGFKGTGIRDGSEAAVKAFINR